MSLEYSKLGPYRVIGLLGRGGMGTVYRGVDETGGEVAIKVLSPLLADDDSFRERFAAEIESLKKLRHSNIVQLYGYGAEAGHLFYAMELIQGKSLHQELKNGRRFDWRDVTRIGIEICAALKHAHDHGIIHRDIKPANLLLDSNDNVKLLDFGIAKLFGVSGITNETVLGTADFMSPEQTEGRTAGPKTDLYSVGAVFYTLLTGKPPFMGKSVPEVVHKLRFEDPIPVSRLAKDVPDQLASVIDKLLAKEPDQRIPTALALAHRLRAVVEAQAVAASQQSDRVTPLKPSPIVERHDTEISSGSQRISDQPTMDFSSGEVVSVTTLKTAGSISDGETHFTTVQSERKVADERSYSWRAVAAVIFFCLAAGLIFFGARMVFKPPSADRLYERIMAEADVEDPRNVLKVKDDIDMFLEFYPSDNRRAELEPLLEQIAIHRQRRRLEQKNDRDLAPAESLYLQAVKLMESDPEAAAERLRALVDLLGTDSTTEIAGCVKLAQHQLQKLDKETANKNNAYIGLIKQQLAAAKSTATKNPDQARKVYQAIIDLFGRHSWATELVDQAEHELSTLTKPAK